MISASLGSRCSSSDLTKRFVTFCLSLSRSRNASSVRWPLVISASRTMSSLLIKIVLLGLALAANESAYFATQDSVPDVARLVHVEDDHADLVVHTKAEGGRIHHL